MAVRIAKMMAMFTYFRGDGCSCMCGSTTCSMLVPASVSDIDTPLTAARRNQVDDREDDDPHDVDEVPVQTDELDLACPLRCRLQTTRPREPDQCQQHQDADGHVRSMEPGHHEEARAEGRRRKLQAFIDERRELVDLTTDERQAEERRRKQPHPKTTMVTTLDRSQSQHH